MRLLLVIFMGFALSSVSVVRADEPAPVSTPTPAPTATPAPTPTPTPTADEPTVDQPATPEPAVAQPTPIEPTVVPQATTEPVVVQTVGKTVTQSRYASLVDDVSAAYTAFESGKIIEACFLEGRISATTEILKAHYRSDLVREKSFGKVNYTMLSMFQISRFCKGADVSLEEVTEAALRVKTYLQD